MVDNKSNGILGREEFEVRKVKEAFRAELKLILERKDFARNLQNIHTPYSLCDEMIGKLERNTSLFDKDFLVFNIEFCEVLLYNYGISRERIWFITDCVEKAAIMNHPRFSGVHVEVINFLEGVENMKSIAGGRKFSVIFQNPPYQAPKEKEHEGRGKCGTSLWEDFVEKSFELCKEDGFIVAIHPPRWRKPNSKIGQKIKNKKVLYLELHNRQDGIKTFGCQTDYDWYIMQNRKNDGETVIVDQEGATVKQNISSMPFIPNAHIKEVMGLIAKDGEEKVELLYNCFYHHQTRTKDGTMKKEKEGEFKYPCVYSVKINDEPTLWYSSIREQFFNVPKVIWGSGHIGVIIDPDGQFGLTEFACGIADTPENLPKIREALQSEKFLGIVMNYKKGSYSGHAYEKDIIKYLRKDFWKSFV